MVQAAHRRPPPMWLQQQVRQLAGRAAAAGAQLQPSSVQWSPLWCVRSSLLMLQWRGFAASHEVSSFGWLCCCTLGTECRCPVLQLTTATSSSCWGNTTTPQVSCVYFRSQRMGICLLYSHLRISAGGDQGGIAIGINHVLLCEHDRLNGARHAML